MYPSHRSIPYSDVQLIQSFICSLADMFGMEQMIAVIGYSMLSSPKMDVVPAEDLATLSAQGSEDKGVTLTLHYIQQRMYC